MIHNEIMKKLEAVLTQKLITEISEDDPTRAGVVRMGPLQGDPDPDEAEISVALYNNNPDAIVRGGVSSQSPSNWHDEIEEIEIGGVATWRRRFTIKARCLLVNDGESLAEANRIASVIRSRIEKTILRTDYSDVAVEDEYVSRGPFAYEISGEMFQSGGPRKL